jgi:hypothetical protein
LLNSRGGRISPSRTSQGMDDDDWSPLFLI